MSSPAAPSNSEHPLSDPGGREPALKPCGAAESALALPMEQADPPQPAGNASLDPAIAPEPILEHDGAVTAATDTAEQRAAVTAATDAAEKQGPLMAETDAAEQRPPAPEPAVEACEIEPPVATAASPKQLQPLNQPPPEEGEPSAVPRHSSDAAASNPTSPQIEMEEACPASAAQSAHGIGEPSVAPPRASSSSVQQPPSQPEAQEPAETLALKALHAPAPPSARSDRIVALREAASRHDVHEPGTPTREEEADPSAMEASLAAAPGEAAAVAGSSAGEASGPAAERPRMAAASRSQRPFTFNSQTIGGIAFFVALNCYKDKDMALAVGLCLEMELYWSFFTSALTKESRSSIRVTSAALSKKPRRASQAKPRSNPRPTGSSRLSRVTLPEDPDGRDPTPPAEAPAQWGNRVGDVPEDSRWVGPPRAMGVEMRGPSVSGSEGDRRGGGNEVSTSLSVPRQSVGASHRKQSQPVRSAPQEDPTPNRPPGQGLGSKPQAKKPRGRPPLVRPTQPLVARPPPVARPSTERSEPGTAKKRGRPPGQTAKRPAAKKARVEGGSGKKPVGRPRKAAPRPPWEGADTEEPTSAVTSEEGEDSEEEEEDAGTPPPNVKKRPSGVFSPTHLAVGDAVLVRTEQDDEDEEWGKCWSLGRVLKIRNQNRSVDVVWLKPRTDRRIRQYSTVQLMGLQWSPWRTVAGKGKVVDWVTPGLGISSIQYGLKLPKDGVFSREDRNTLAAEVGRLERA